eukprot:NP_497673.2 Uncharacterized protein CELE_H09G03.1 [Caenorhabditis elegans]
MRLAHLRLHIPISLPISHNSSVRKITIHSSFEGCCVQPILLISKLLFKLHLKFQSLEIGGLSKKRFGNKGIKVKEQGAKKPFAFVIFQTSVKFEWTTLLGSSEEFKNEEQAQNHARGQPESSTVNTRRFKQGANCLDGIATVVQSKRFRAVADKRNFDTNGALTSFRLKFQRSEANFLHQTELRLQIVSKKSYQSDKGHPLIIETVFYRMKSKLLLLLKEYRTLFQYSLPHVSYQTILILPLSHVFLGKITKQVFFSFLSKVLDTKIQCLILILLFLENIGKNKIRGSYGKATSEHCHLSQIE